MNKIIVAAHCAAVLTLAAGAARAGDPIEVCVAESGALRLLESGSCAPGESKKMFAEWEQEIEEAEPDANAAEAEKTLKLEAQVEQLAGRLAAIEAEQAQARARSRAEAAGGSTVTAPFEVVSASGTVILRVADSVSSSDGGGARVTIGAGDGGNYALRVHRGGGPFIAGIGQSTNGAGLAIVMDANGETAANMNGTERSVNVYRQGAVVAAIAAEDRGGLVAVYNGNTPIAYLTQSSGGDGGNVTTALNSGFGVFSAGAAQDGGGEACINRVTGGGQQRNACLGLELPSMGLGK